MKVTLIQRDPTGHDLDLGETELRDMLALSLEKGDILVLIPRSIRPLLQPDRERYEILKREFTVMESGETRVTFWVPMLVLSGKALE